MSDPVSRVRVPFKHLFSQGANLAALGRVGWSLVAPGKREQKAMPGEQRVATLPPRGSELVRDFVSWSEGTRWDGLPPHFFPQWGLPLLAQTLDDQPHPVARVLNQGCRLTIAKPLPADEELNVTAQLVSVEVGERKVRLHQRLVTGTASAPEAVIADVYAVVPTGKGRGSGERPVVDPAWERLVSRDLPGNAGWQFALLTGDFNPIHWLTLYAKAAGFRRTILHGFGMLALATEALAVKHGPERIHTIDVRFLRPLVLPASIEIAAADGHIGLGVPDEPAAMLGTYELHGETP